MIANTHTFQDIKKIIADNHVTLKDFNQMISEIKDDDERIASFVRWQKKTLKSHQ